MACCIHQSGSYDPAVDTVLLNVYRVVDRDHDVFSKEQVAAIAPKARVAE